MQYGNMYGGGQQGQPHQGQGMGSGPRRKALKCHSRQPTIVFNQAPVMGQGGSQMVSGTELLEVDSKLMELY